MRLMHGLPLRRMRRPLCLAAGVFDGVHLGHREIISSAVRLSQERGCVPAVLTFAPHPDTVLFHKPVPPQLTTLDEKLVLLGTLGVQLTIVARFDRSLAITPAESFVRDLLADRLHACCLTVGEGWRFGARGQGNAELLEGLSRELGFHFLSCPPVTRDGAVISSTRIRGFLAEGRVAEAAQLLARPYQLSGEVVSGDQRGRQLGFPTANLNSPPFKAMPADGIYACWAGVGRYHPAVASVGVRPTFEKEGERRLEVHLLDQARRPHLLGRRLHVAFVAHLREERRFGSVEALVAQMGEDCAQARALLAPLQPPGVVL
jgi:riboflavin kinase / FMN adenylyltransferase